MIASLVCSFRMISTIQDVRNLVSTLPSMEGLPVSEFDTILNLLIQGSLDRKPLLITIGDALSNGTNFKVDMKFNSGNVGIHSWICPTKLISASSLSKNVVFSRNF